MPHVIVKASPGRSEDQKKRLAEAITRAVTDIYECDDQSVSVAIEEVEPEQWRDQVYTPEIVGRPTTIYKKPGYAM